MFDSVLVLVVRKAPVWHYSMVAIPYLVTTHIITTTTALKPTQPRIQTTGCCLRPNNKFFDGVDSRRRRRRTADERTLLLPNLLPNSFIPEYCIPLKHNYNINSVQINSSGNDSVLVITAYLYEGLKLTEGFECHVMVTAPRDMGIVTTIKKASFHDNDTFYFRSGSNPEKAWSPQTEDYRLKEIVAVPNRGEASNIFLRFKPSTNRSQHNAGFEIAFTAFKEKGDSCGDDFDCGNDRCVWSELVCDGYNNCGNEKDESGCAGVSLWVIILLIGVGILVVMLAIFVWYRMAQR